MVAGQEKSGWVKRGDWVKRREDGSREGRMGQEKGGWVKRREDGSREGRMGQEKGGWVKRREDGSREGRMARMRVMAGSRVADGKVQRTPYQLMFVHAPSVD